MVLPAKKVIRRRLRDSYELDGLYWETMGIAKGNTKEKPLRVLAALLEATGTPYALIGGVAVQLYSREPRSTKDIDIAVPTFADIPREALERAGFTHERRFAHSDIWRAPGPGARRERVAVQFSAEDVGIAAAVAHATPTDIDEGLHLRLATVPDLVVLKLAAADEPRRRASKRSQDCTDVIKLVEEHPEVRAALPDVQVRVQQLLMKIAMANLEVDLGEAEE